MNSPTAGQIGGTKRGYQSDEIPSLHPQSSNASTPPSPPLTSAAASSAFRNVSACNRCRLRKNRCDQNLPACTACEKAHVKCIGYDPITKREIPRSYVYFLETRLSYFESLLVANNIPFRPPEAFDVVSKPLDGSHALPKQEKGSLASTSIKVEETSERQLDQARDAKQEEVDSLNKLVSTIGMVSVQGASDPRYLGSTSGISFARVVFAAVKSSVSSNNSERGGVRPSKPVSNVASSGGSSMRDSFFGLQTKPTINQAPLPDRQLGQKLVRLYFEHANPQIPILHRGDFMDLFNRAYSADSRDRTPRELYWLNIVFAIGAGIIFGSSDEEPSSVPEYRREITSPSSKRTKFTNQQHQPEEYHASAIVHLESFLASSPSAERPDGFAGGLEELQAVLLLAGFALLRPVAPGLWYIVGVAVRLAVDLGLHYEDGSGIDFDEDVSTLPAKSQDVAMEAAAETLDLKQSIDAKERGRRGWMRDLRRRLWWCVYSFDRLVSTCVGRPFGITDEVVTTEFPSLHDDAYITKNGLIELPSPDVPSYKHVSYHYFRLRLLQSEILQVLQHQQAQQARQNGANQEHEYMHTKLQSPFLAKFKSNFRAWRRDIDRRLLEWKESAPKQEETGVQFSPEFLELNYWQAIIMLYRQSLSVPAPLAEMNQTEDVSTPSVVGLEEPWDEEDVFVKVAEAGQKILRLYRQLHRVRLVNYTFLATHHLFMAGISFLYAVWHSPHVRSHLTLDDVDFTILAATSVLSDLMEKCPPAEACRNAFERMSKATVQMCMASGGLGHSKTRDREPSGSRSSFVSSSGEENTSTHPNATAHQYAQAQKPTTAKRRRPPPKFDMNLRDLFPDEIDQNNLPSQSFPQSMSVPARQQQQQSAPPQILPPTQQSQQMSLNTQINAGLGMGDPIAAGAVNPLFAQQQTQNPSPFYNTSVYGSQYVGMPGMDFLNNVGDEFHQDTSGIDLGFGMGMDFQHDWSDGTQFDLFDGFFFGNG